MIGTFDRERREVTVVGAGVAGLLAAYNLDRKGYRVTLLEERESAGGLIRTVRTEHGIAERAAHSLLATPAVTELCRDLGVELLEIRKDSRARYVVRGRRLRKFPLGLGETVSTLSRAALARASEADSAGVTLEAWGRTHLGAPAVDYLLTPFVGGIYGARPSELGVESAFPMLSVAPGQTLLGTMLHKALHRAPKNGAEKKTDGAKRERKRMVAPRGGMGALTEALERRLEERLGERFRRGVRVTSPPDAPNVLVATPAQPAARLLRHEAPSLSSMLDEVTYTPIVTVTAFVARENFTRDVRGVGALVPAREGRKCLGILFNSSAFEGRVRDERRVASFTLMFGGSARPEWVTASDGRIASAVVEELRDLLGVEGLPLELVITRHARAIPQYSTGLPRLWASARETWCARPGRLLFGNYTGQVSLRGMIEASFECGA